jgi:NTE family protein
LNSAGIVPDVIAGTSIGAVVGAFWAAGKLPAIEEFAYNITRRQVVNFLDVSLFGSGLIGGRRLASLLHKHLGDMTIDQLGTEFVAVATDLTQGREVWLETGSVVEALTASYALPALFCPVRVGNDLLVDGAFSNPLPVSACRALGADVVIGVNVNPETLPSAVLRTSRARDNREGEVESVPVERSSAPGLPMVLRDAFNVAICRIAHARLQDSPPDLLIRPNLKGCGYFEFQRGAELIQLGEETGRRALRAVGFTEREPAGETRQLVAAE